MGHMLYEFSRHLSVSFNAWHLTLSYAVIFMCAVCCQFSHLHLISGNLGDLTLCVISTLPVSRFSSVNTMNTFFIRAALELYGEQQSQGLRWHVYGSTAISYQVKLKLKTNCIVP